MFCSICWVVDWKDCHCGWQFLAFNYAIADIGISGIYYPVKYPPTSDELCYSMPVTNTSNNGARLPNNGENSTINGGSSTINEESSTINSDGSSSNYGRNVSQQNIIDLKPVPREALIHNSELLAIAEPVRTKKGY